MLQHHVRTTASEIEIPFLMFRCSSFLGVRDWFSPEGQHEQNEAISGGRQEGGYCLGHMGMEFNICLFSKALLVSLQIQILLCPKFRGPAGECPSLWPDRVPHRLRDVVGVYQHPAWSLR